MKLKTLLFTVLVILITVISGTVMAATGININGNIGEEKQEVIESNVKYTEVTSNKAKKPATPKIISISATNSKAKLKWSKVVGNGYEIYMSTSIKGKYKKVKTIKRYKTVTYTKKSLKPGKKYYFKIRAYKILDSKKVYSNYSKVKSVKTSSMVYKTKTGKKYHYLKCGNGKYTKISITKAKALHLEPCKKCVK